MCSTTITFRLITELAFINKMVNRSAAMAAGTMLLNIPSVNRECLTRGVPCLSHRQVRLRTARMLRALGAGHVLRKDSRVNIGDYVVL